MRPGGSGRRCTGTGRGLRLAFGPVAVWLAWLGVAGAEPLAVGEWVVADPDAREILRVAGPGDAASVIAADQLLLYPHGVAIESALSVIVADPDANALVRVNVDTGEQVIVCSDGLLLFPTDVTLAANGDFLVVDPDANEIIRVEESGCVMSVERDDMGLLWPTGISRTPDGDLRVADPDANVVVRSANGGPFLEEMADGFVLAATGISAAGDVAFVIDPIAREIVAYDAGSVTSIAASEAWLYPTGLAGPVSLASVPALPSWGIAPLGIALVWISRRANRPFGS